MNSLDNDEKVIKSIRSVPYMQMALTNYLQSFLKLLKAEFNIIDHQTIEDSVHRMKKSVNQLQNLTDARIRIYSENYSEPEINTMFKMYQPLNEKINSEFNQFFLTLQKQRKN
ncbi:hypothetical protein PH210_14210 [Paenibacillus sp. BSR1-1]|uniref:hypothetical protein n=1 Tax=Paenibacillus sp. BSR1-1 TaxID=3020845 RepID=UPI0025B114DA|nr:hypothetical protein [Paenibacillus sp. BSR1-1]MDN3017349.1 hypothetical protein [Paenibacillus sp. BSR1-1]